MYLLFETRLLFLRPTKATLTLSEHVLAAVQVSPRQNQFPTKHNLLEADQGEVG